MKAQTAADVSVKIIPLQSKVAIEPLSNWVLIRKYVAEEKLTEEGVIIPAAQARSQRGLVVAASEPSGPYAAQLVRLHPGDVVIYTNFPLEIENDLEDLTGEKGLDLVRYEEVYARVKTPSVIQAT
jgi:co-chaperonin GroES (HSP10)